MPVRVIVLSALSMLAVPASAQPSVGADGTVEPSRTDGTAASTTAVVAVSPSRAEADPDDVDSVESIVRAAYEAIQRAPGEDFDWDRFRTLFVPQATLIPNAEQSPGGTFTVYSPESFITTMDSYTTVGGPSDRGFAEEGVHLEVHRYGDVAQAFSTYQKHFWGDDRILGRGINSFQLVYHADRWWIASIAWDEENGAGPIPAEYGGR